MKKRICLQICVLLLLGGLCFTCSKDKTQDRSGKDRIVMNSSPELYELTREWAGVFCKLNPEVEIEVVKTSESSIAENLNNTAQLSFVTSNFESEIYDRSLWKVIVGRDIIVPVINTGNPFLPEIYSQGISPAGLALILNNPENTSWRTLIKNGPDVPVNLYMKDDAALEAGIAGFLEEDQISFREINTMDPQKLVATVQNDKYSLGICNLLDIIDPRDQDIVENIMILPIDRNGNGLVDYKEDIYASLDAFTRGAWIGKYPRKLSNNIYTVSTSPPGNANELAFLKFIITKGQVLLDNHDFYNLPEFERMAGVRLIDSYGVGQPAPGDFTLPKEPGFFTSPLPVVLTILLFLTFLLYFGIRIVNRRRAGIPLQESVIPGSIFNEENVRISPGLYYDKTHTWAFLENNGMVKVGIDDFLQRVTGPLTRVKMKSPGERIKKGRQAFSIIQDGKQLDISAPVSGTIVEQNTNLDSDSSILNASPYTDGWIYKVEPVSWVKEVQFLIMGNHYKKWLKSEFQRLKDFLADAIGTGNEGYAHVLQDGGELRENILRDYGPETWEDFQTNFIDMSS